MVLYLSSVQHTNLLDFTGLYEPDSGMPIKRMVGWFSLKQFIVYDMRNFSHFTDVVLVYGTGNGDLRGAGAIRPAFWGVN